MKLYEMHFPPVVGVVPLAVHLQTMLALAHELLPVHRGRAHGSISTHIIVEDVERYDILTRRSTLRLLGVGGHVLQGKSLLIIFVRPDGVERVRSRRGPS